VLSGLGLVAFGTSDRYAIVVSLAVVVATLLAVVRYERGLKRAVAEVARGGRPARYPGRWIRYVIGVDEPVLAAFPGDVVRLIRLGFMTLISALLPAATPRSRWSPRRSRSPWCSRSRCCWPCSPAR
jgi:hypothetical protein